MVIIQLAGGLGNQMFQYALYLQLKSLGKDVKIDDVSGFVEDKQRVPVLAPFGADYERASGKELRRMLDSSPFLHAKIRRKLCGRKKKAYFEEDKCYRPEIMEWDDIYLEGYWQTEKYFQTVSGQVREVFDTDKLIRYIESKYIEDKYIENRYIENRYIENRYIDDKYIDNEYAEKQAVAVRSQSMRDWLEQINSTESVGVHIRRGDYLLPANQELFGNICTEEYYRTAMEQMAQEHPGCVFYLFTNDKRWAAERAVAVAAEAARPERIEIVETRGIPDGGMDRDYAEFALMSKCRHNIMANSSFSWWASYLNRNPHKTVLAPDKWLNGWDCEDIYRADMKRKGTKLHEQTDIRRGK